MSREVGKTRPYVFNPRYPFLNELKALLEKALSFYSEKEREELMMNRRRPRATGQTIMKQIKNMSQAELAAYVQFYLQKAGIDVVLSGGSAVSFYSSNKYVSKDLDLININFAKRDKRSGLLWKGLASKKKDAIL